MTQMEAEGMRSWLNSGGLFRALLGLKNCKKIADFKSKLKGISNIQNKTFIPSITQTFCPFIIFLNPLSFYWKIRNKIQIIQLMSFFPHLNLQQIGLMTVTLFPIRLLIAAFMMLLAWPFAFLASVGRSETAVEPQCLWRR